MSQSVKVNARKVNERYKSPEIKLSVIPVKVHDSAGQLIPTLAFLDGGSMATLCTEDLLNKLNFQKTVPTQLSISTIAKDGIKVDSLMVAGLEVCDPDENNLISLPPVFTVKKLPVAEDDVMTQEDLKEWPHLQDLEITTLNSDIGLMIGNNVPQAVEPGEIIHSPKEGGPFAVISKLGSTPVRVNRIKVQEVNLDQMLTRTIMSF